MFKSLYTEVSLKMMFLNSMVPIGIQRHEIPIWANEVKKHMGVVTGIGPNFLNCY
jgi:hypothetical protein